MTKHSDLNDISTVCSSEEVSDSLKKVQQAPISDSVAVPDKSYLGKVVTLSARTKKTTKIPYDIELEKERRENRIANMGLPSSSTATGL